MGFLSGGDDPISGPAELLVADLAIAMHLTQVTERESGRYVFFGSILDVYPIANSLHGQKAY